MADHSRRTLYREIALTPWGAMTSVFAVLSVVTWLRDEALLPDSLQHWKMGQLLHYWPPAWVWALLAIAAIMEGAYRVLRKRLTAAELAQRSPPPGRTGIRLTDSSGEVVDPTIQGMDTGIDANASKVKIKRPKIT